MPVKLDWDDLSFKFHPTKTMFVSTCPIDGVWDEGEYKPFGELAISPAAGVLNYGQGIFEGMKAHRAEDGRVLLFRPEENAKRFRAGAERLCMMPYPEAAFVEAVEQTIRENADYIPPYGKGALYIRPALWGTGPILGVAPAPEYTFCVFVSPVGNYYKGDLAPIKLVFSEDFHRAATKGVGHIKTIGNYAGGIQKMLAAKEKGYNGIIYLDAMQEKYIEEVGTSNFFCINKKGELVTPALGSILPGITRASIIDMARDQFGLTVVEKKVTIEEALTARECFCSGTAAVITPIGLINHEGTDHTINDFEVGEFTRKIYDTLVGIQRGDLPDPYGWVKVVAV